MTPTLRQRHASQNLSCSLLLLFVVGLIGLAVLLLIPLMAERMVGPAAEGLGFSKRLQYSALVLWYDGLLTEPVSPYGLERDFTIGPGQGASEVAYQLETEGFVPDGAAFRAYLVYSGIETRLQAGQFNLSPALTPLQIAVRLQDATPAEIKFVILPGWRAEEIAASLPTSGLNITPEDFLAAVQAPPGGFDFLPAAASAEGFLLPDTYILPREIGAEDLLRTLVSNFALNLRSDLRSGFQRQELDIYQAVILASIVQREALLADEQPLIASVFLNRLKAGMRLQTDPTVQYALGYDPLRGSWWKSPLMLDDLEVASPYNTYRIDGLPPAPIANPSLGALQAVAAPAQTPYYYFRARCDDSGLHLFAETFEAHLQNACP
ncbi:MAG: endolytic transglycosylase MltG [Anaerolineales bacterium]|jgi:UPF0755 protein|nr:endolytic transglycosylase MltG [Anaerolineales bacterium]